MIAREVKSGLLEAEVWPECHPQIILRAIQEINLVANVEPKSKWSPESFQAYARVQREPRVAVGYPVNRSNKSYAVPAGVAKVHETDLPGSEGIEMAFAELKLRPEKPGQRTQTGGYEACGQPVIGCEAVVAREIIHYFAFNTGIGIDINTEPTTDADKVGHVILVQPEVIGERAELDMVFGLREGHSRYYE